MLRPARTGAVCIKLTLIVRNDRATGIALHINWHLGCKAILVFFPKDVLLDFPHQIAG